MCKQIEGVCYPLNISPRNSYVKALLSNVIVFEAGAFGR